MRVTAAATARADQRPPRLWRRRRWARTGSGALARRPAPSVGRAADEERPSREAGRGGGAARSAATATRRAVAVSPPPAGVPTGDPSCTRVGNATRDRRWPPPPQPPAALPSQTRCASARPPPPPPPPPSSPSPVRLPRHARSPPSPPPAASRRRRRVSRAHTRRVGNAVATARSWSAGGSGGVRASLPAPPPRLRPATSVTS